MGNIFDYTLEELETQFTEIDIKKYTATQIYDWIYKKNIFDIDKMTNLNIKTKNLIKNSFEINLLKIKNKIKSKNTIKYLFELNDGNLIESVIMKHGYGISSCISSQVGCNMGCSFCQSGKNKKIRNLSINELVLQIVTMKNDIKTDISSIVIMGIGEPFDNYENIKKFIKIINNKNGLNIGFRHITVSTAGLVNYIKKFSEEEPKVNLAISLHAPNDTIRNKLMPINKTFNLNKLINAIKNYTKLTNKRVCIQYILLKDINDSTENATELANLLKNMNIYVNLIPYNDTSNKILKCSDEKNIKNFLNILKKNKIDACVRVRFGEGINAACGQLRINEINTKNK